MTPTQRKAMEKAHELLNTVESIPPFHATRTSVIHALRAALAEPAPEPDSLPSVITEEMHQAACKVLVRANGLDGTPQRMLDAMRAVSPKPPAEPAPVPVAWGDVKTRQDGKRYCRAVSTTDQSNLGYLPLYTAPQALAEPAPPTDVPLLDDDWIIDMANEMHRAMPDGSDEQEELIAIVREAEKEIHRKAAPVREPAQTTCNCRWEGDTQVQECTLHQAHKEAIHEWAERAKTAEAKLASSEPAPDHTAELEQEARLMRARMDRLQLERDTIAQSIVSRLEQGFGATHAAPCMIRREYLKPES